MYYYKLRLGKLTDMHDFLIKICQVYWRTDDILIRYGMRLIIKDRS